MNMSHIHIACGCGHCNCKRVTNAGADTVPIRMRIVDTMRIHPPVAVTPHQRRHPPSPSPPRPLTIVRVAIAISVNVHWPVHLHLPIDRDVSMGSVATWAVHTHLNPDPMRVLFHRASASALFSIRRCRLFRSGSRHPPCTLHVKLPLECLALIIVWIPDPTRFSTVPSPLTSLSQPARSFVRHHEIHSYSYTACMPYMSSRARDLFITVIRGSSF